MSTSAWGFLISRALAVIGAMILISQVGTFLAAGVTLLYSTRAFGAAAWGFAIELCVVLLFLWLLANLWIRARQFGALAPSSDEKPLAEGPVDPARLVCLGLGLYFLISGAAYVLGEWANLRTRERMLGNNEYWFLIDPTARAISGLLLLAFAKWPDSLRKLASWPGSETYIDGTPREEGRE